MVVDISICAVTFKRPGGLARLIDSLARLKIPDDVIVEVVLVDNDPAGSAVNDPQRVEAAGTLPIRWQHEPAGDIARARNRCIAAAEGRWIAFIDDDEAAHESWIAAYALISEESDADGFFGPVLPCLEVPRESWLDLATFYNGAKRATGALLGISGAFTSNAFVRRSLLREVSFDPAFGRTLGEDTDCFLRALERGAKFVWCNEACVSEFLPPERHSMGFLTRRALEGASAWSHIQAARSESPRVVQALVGVLRLATATLWLPLAFLGGRRRAFSAWLRLCIQLGRLYGLAGGHVERTGR